MNTTKQILEQRTADIDKLIASIGGIVLTIGGVEQEPEFPETAGWQPMVAVPGLSIKPIVPHGFNDSDYFNTRGVEGTHSEQTSIPQSSQFTVLTGAILWRQQWANGGKPIRLESGQTAWLQPNEKHSYLFLTDCVCTVVITPPLAHHTPRIP